MVSSLQALIPGLAYIHAGPVLWLRFPAPPPLPLRHVLPNALDTTAVDWFNAATCVSPVALGAAVRLTLAKVKEGVEARGAKVSFGENFSPARARQRGTSSGWWQCSAAWRSVQELDAVEGDGKVEEAKAAVRPLLDEVVVLDFVVGPAGKAPTPASL